MGRFVLAFAVALLVGVVVSPPAFAAFPGANGRIVFYAKFYGGLVTYPGCDSSACAYEDDTYALRTVRPDGTRLRGLGSCRRGRPCSDTGATFSPDGRWLAFDVNGASLVISRPDGSHRRTVPTPEAVDRVYEPTWSPDGRQLAFVGVRSEPDRARYDIFVANRDGSDARAVTDGARDGAPAWSTNGLIAFERSETESEKDFFAPDIHVVDLRTGDEQRLSRRGGGTAPSWAPDGVRLAFTRGPYPGATSLHVLNTKTGRTRRIVDRASDPGWSPDGRFIAYGCKRGLCKVSPKKRRERVLVRRRGALHFGDVDWQPLRR
jgi:Tol biopolymer transport system component